MPKSLLLMICILIGLLVLACGKTAETNRNANATAPSNSTAPAPAASVVTNRNTNSPGSTAATSAEKIGVAECDAFLTAYESCISKVPEAGRAQYQNAVSQWRASWKKLADNPTTRGTLAGICKNAHDSARLQMKSYNCTL